MGVEVRMLQHLFRKEYGVHVLVDRTLDVLCLVIQICNGNVFKTSPSYFSSVGTLSFGIAYPAGLVIGIWTFVNMTWNMFVIFYHPTYFSTLKNKAESEFRDAMLKEASRRAGADIKALDAGIPKKQWDEEQKIREAQEEIIAGIPEASGQAEISQEDGNWVMRTDDQSGKHRVHRTT